MRLLILGGTAWLGHTVAAFARDHGHDVTCLARGSAAVPEGVRLVVADRSTADPGVSFAEPQAGPDPYAAVPGEWDAVLDVSRQPGQVRAAVRALAGRAAYLAFVSTCSVYADSSAPHPDESAAVVEPFVGEVAGDADYGSGKMACEQAVLAGFGAARCLIARAGLIGGPGDWSGRSGYWPWRFANPSTDDGAVVVPAEPELAAQVVDVRDLAAWLLECCAAARPGVVDAVGPSVPLAEHLATARAVAGHTGPVLDADPDWLVAQGISHWMGERSMPLWLPLPEYAGFAARRGERARALGLTTRPLAQTLADALGWERQRAATDGPDRLWRSGLDDDQARALVQAWRARGAAAG